MARRLGRDVFGRRPRFGSTRDEEVDLRDLEPRQRDVEALDRQEVDQFAEFDRKQLTIPARLFGDSVVGNRIGALLGLSEMTEAEDRNMSKSFEARGLEPPMAGENHVRVVDDRRIEKAELTNALRDLRGSASSNAVARFSGSGAERLDWRPLYPRRGRRDRFDSSMESYHSTAAITTSVIVIRRDLGRWREKWIRQEIQVDSTIATRSRDPMHAAPLGQRPSTRLRGARQTVDKPVAGRNRGCQIRVGWLWSARRQNHVRNHYTCSLVGRHVQRA